MIDTCTITANGTASNIHKNQNSDAPNNIHKKMSNGFTQSFCDMIEGTIILFSAACIARNKIAITKNHFHQNQIRATSSAGTLPKIGHRYGINSVNQAISAKENLFGKSIPNQLTIHKPIATVSPIIRHNNNCPSSHNHNFIEIFCRVTYVCFGLLVVSAMNVKTAIRSIEKNIAIVITTTACTKVLNIASTMFTANDHALFKLSPPTATT